jgi:mRNA interferase YafQ
MRTIDRSSAFKRDYKRESRGRHRVALNAYLVPILMDLANDRPLPLHSTHRDHDLSGDWSGYSECHIKPDLLLIYRKAENGLLRLARLGSHSEVFG